MEAEGVAHEIGALLCAFLARAGHALGDTFSGILYDANCCKVAVVDFMVAAEFDRRRTVYVVCAKDHVCEMDVHRHADRVEAVKIAASLKVDAQSRWQLQIQRARMLSIFGESAELLGVIAAPSLRDDVVRAADLAGMECFSSEGTLEFAFM